MLESWTECMRWLFLAFQIIGTVLMLVGMLAALMVVANWVVGRLLDWRVILELAHEARKQDRSVWKHVLRANRWNGRP